MLSIPQNVLQNSKSNGSIRASCTRQSVLLSERPINSLSSLNVQSCGTRNAGQITRKKHFSASCVEDLPVQHLFSDILTSYVSGLSLTLAQFLPRLFKSGTFFSGTRGTIDVN